MFFEQLVFRTFVEAVPEFQDVPDPMEYNPPDRTTDIAVYRDAQRIPYTNQG